MHWVGKLQLHVIIHMASRGCTRSSKKYTLAGSKWLKWGKASWGFISPSLKKKKCIYKKHKTDKVKQKTLVRSKKWDKSKTRAKGKDKEKLKNRSLLQKDKYNQCTIILNQGITTTKYLTQNRGEKLWGKKPWMSWKFRHCETRGWNNPTACCYCRMAFKDSRITRLINFGCGSWGNANHTCRKLKKTKQTGRSWQLHCQSPSFPQYTCRIT